MMRNVVFVITNLVGGGAEKSVLTLAAEFARRGYGAHVILLTREIDYEIPTGVRVHRLTETDKATRVALPNTRVLAVLLRTRLREIEAEFGSVIAVFSNLPATDQVVSRARLQNVFYVIQNTMSRPLRRKAPLKRLRRWRTFRKTYDRSRLIAISNGVAEDLVRELRVRPEKIYTVYHPFDIEGIRALASQGENLPEYRYLLHAGIFSRQKRHDILFRAIRMLDTDIKLLLLVSESEPLWDLIRSEGVEDRVVIAGFHQNPYPIMKHAQLLVLSSDWEGFGRVIVESLACGTPVVSTDCPSGPSEILRGELSNCLVPCGDPEALARKIDQALACSIEIPDELVRAFSVDKVVDELVSIMKENSIDVLPTIA